jgi:hypothetical protein
MSVCGVQRMVREANEHSDHTGSLPTTGMYCGSQTDSPTMAPLGMPGSSSMRMTVCPSLFGSLARHVMAWEGDHF